jgi:hypothetical protein
MRRVFAVATVKLRGSWRTSARGRAPHPVLHQHKKGIRAVAKKVLPIHLDARDREILRLTSEREGCSMAEVVRRTIRTLAVQLVPAPRGGPPLPPLEPTGPDNAR